MTKLTTALIQTSLHWEDPQANLSMFDQWFTQLPEHTDLVLLPEMFTSAFTMNPQHLNASDTDRTISWLKSRAEELQVALMGSMVYPENESFYNRLLFVSPDGIIKHYDKRHTFTLAGEDKVYTRGSKRLCIPYKGFNICPMICYDLRFPVWSRYQEDYDVLVYLANWPETRITAWDTLLKARAIENMSYCIGVNRLGEDRSGLRYNGHSAVYNGLGEQMNYSEKEEILVTELHREPLYELRKKLRFLDDRDAFVIQ